jgi:hypothetical protein
VLIDANGVELGLPFTGAPLLDAKNWRRELMPKRTSDERHDKSQMNADEAPPPFLSEKLIAQLQGAVSAAQRKRIPKPIDNVDREVERDF